MAKLVIIGTGGIGRRHIRGALAGQRADVHVIEPDDERRQMVCDEFDVVDAGPQAEAGGLRGFDLAVIAAPANFHVSLAMECVEVGVPFLLEKPLSVSLDGVDEMIAAVSAAGLPARVAYVRRASPEFLALKEQLAAGRVGDLKLAYINSSQEYPKYRPDYRDIYYAREAMGGGAIMDAACHMLDLLIWYFGDIATVSAATDRLVLEGVECEDTVLLTVRFADGRLAQININQFQKPNTFQLELVGTAANLLLEGTAVKYADDDSGAWQSEEFNRDADSAAYHSNRFRRQIDMMFDLIGGGNCPLTTLDEARHNLHAALAAKESARDGRRVALTEVAE